MSKQPRDDANYPIPVLGYSYNRGQQLALGASTISARIAASVRVVSLYATADCFFEICDSDGIANTSTSHFLPAGIYLDVALGSDNNAAFMHKYIAAASDNLGILYISERI